MLCQCVITSHRDILSHVTYCRTSARELWAHPPPPPRTLLAADVARHTASRHASLRSARSEATLRSSQFGVTHYNYYRIAEDVARYAATLHTSLRSAHAKRSYASLESTTRGVPTELSVSLYNLPHHPFSRGLANSLVYIVGFRQRRGIK